MRAFDYKGPCGEYVIRQNGINGKYLCYKDFSIYWSNNLKDARVFTKLEQALEWCNEDKEQVHSKDTAIMWEGK